MRFQVTKQKSLTRVVDECTESISRWKAPVVEFKVKSIRATPAATSPLASLSSQKTDHAGLWLVSSFA
jgi:hypothetical protein